MNHTPLMLAELEAERSLLANTIEKASDVLTRCLQPDGISRAEAIGELHDLLDLPSVRAVVAAAAGKPTVGLHPANVSAGAPRDVPLYLGYNDNIATGKVTAIYALQVPSPDAIPCLHVVTEEEPVSAQMAELIGRLTQWRYCMSYDSSYFGEPAGLLKRTVRELEKRIDAAQIRAAHGDDDQAEQRAKLGYSGMASTVIDQLCARNYGSSATGQEQAFARAIEFEVLARCTPPNATLQKEAPSWPAGMLERVKAAEQRLIDGHSLRRIPADPTDVDMVLAEMRDLIEGKWPPSWLKLTPEGDLHAEVARLNQIVNSPQSGDFLRAVSTEGEHQRQRWGSSHDAGKTAADWFWLVGHLAGKALHAHAAGNVEKAEHHVITTAAALLNWHMAMFGKTDMRPGIDGARHNLDTEGRAA
ncbi:MAG: hypothetical protein GAK35_01046 [Herbaspirillum frisingense]|uniref:Uncharacterized protein n=1 Tax=Herbaspirillum frisingense TaxID=92645 RepID=A0A7V8JV56_9BURK|nr:MAG: hypothetical protein GAK35_01046 [Herbaspirillum frisingense]